MRRKFLPLLFFVLLISIAFQVKKLPEPYVFPDLKFFPPMPASAANPVTVEGAALGRHLFYDPLLSDDNTMSCASCHKQANAFSDAALVFSKGKNGSLMKRNTMPLFNLAWYPSLFWDGRAANIEEQVFHPVRAHDEMNLPWTIVATRINNNSFYTKMFQQAFPDQQIDSVLISKAIAQFLRTLISNGSKYDQVLAGETKFTTEELEGFDLMNDQTKGDCLHCHTTDADALGTTLEFSNNGLDAVATVHDYADKGRGAVTGKLSDNGKFRIPSLRNLLFTAPYMHDGRFNTLEQVLDFYSEGVKKSPTIDSKMGSAHQGGVRLTPSEKNKIILFLKTLSDSVFVSNPAFRNPFVP